jgi:uncharacterized damage-inducible protein DinB
VVVNRSHLDPRVAQIARLFDHMAWADATMAVALNGATIPQAAIREFAHVAGVEEVWLSRIEHRPHSVAIWPDIGVDLAASLAARAAGSFHDLIFRCNDAMLDAPVKYTNTAGKTFATPLGDILLHVAMHGQYHRGKVNLILRQNDVDPAPVDFIAFARGVPAATQKDAATARR